MKLNKLVVLSSFLFLLSCTTAPISGRHQVKLVSDEEIVSASAKSYSAMMQEYQSNGSLITSGADYQRVQRVGKNLSAAVEKFLREQGYEDKLKTLNWEYNLVQSDEVNAFCLPGGKIVFYTGILPVTQDDTGMATVMGHEIAHAIAGHHAEGSSQNTLLNVGAMLGDVFTGGSYSQLIGLGAQLTSLQFNRTQEYEADHLGLVFMAMAGYDPNKGTDVWYRMIEQTGKSNGTDILSTHPGAENRIAKMKEEYITDALKYYKK